MSWEAAGPVKYRSHRLRRLLKGLDIAFGISRSFDPSDYISRIRHAVLRYSPHCCAGLEPLWMSATPFSIL
jgi:hypothetical protein